MANALASSSCMLFYAVLTAAVWLLSAMFALPSEADGGSSQEPLKDSALRLSAEQESRLALFARDRPRLLLNRGKIRKLRVRLKSAPYDSFWENVRGRANRFSGLQPPSALTRKNKDPLRRIGKRLPFMAMAYLLTNHDNYLQGAKKWMDFVALAPRWPGRDLDEAHALAGMAIVYDWLHNQFTEVERNRYRTTMIEHADAIMSALVERKEWWAKDYLQNHNYLNAMALGLTGLSLAGESKRSSLYVAAAEKNFQSVLSLLSPDGASHEGVHYWSYGTQAMLMYFMAASPVFGLEDVRNSGYFQNATRFRLYASLPGYREIANYGDSSRKEFYYSGAQLRLLASLFKDGHAQWLAERLDKSRGDEALVSWLDFPWYDPSVKPVAPDNLPRYSYFSNLGIFFGRSDWSDNATWVFFKAGPPQGRLAASKGVFTGSHIHPDAGGFSLWANGGWLIIDDSYVWLKKTENHSVLLVNGKGQIGEGKRWFDKKGARRLNATATIVREKLNPNAQLLQADLAGMYPPEAGVEKWRRTFAFLPQGYVVVRDEVQTAKQAELEILVHLNKGHVDKTGNAVSLRAGKRGILIDDVSLNPAEISIGDYDIEKLVNRLNLSVPPRVVVRMCQKDLDSWSATQVLRPFHTDRAPGVLAADWSSGEAVLKLKDGVISAVIDFLTLEVKVN